MAFDPARRSAPSSATCSATIFRRCSVRRGQWRQHERDPTAARGWPKHLARPHHARLARERDPRAVREGAREEERDAPEGRLRMSAGVRPLTERPAWNALQRHYEEIRSVHLRTLFADDPRRGERHTAEAAGLYLDYSKHRVTDETVRLLVALAGESDLPARIDAMFRGDKINVTEHRAVLHVALRTPRGRSIVVDGGDVGPQVHAVLDRMADFATRVRDGRWTGHTGKRIR